MVRRQFLNSFLFFVLAVAVVSVTAFTLAPNVKAQTSTVANNTFYDYNYSTVSPYSYFPASNFDYLYESVGIGILSNNNGYYTFSFDTIQVSSNTYNARLYIDISFLIRDNSLFSILYIHDLNNNDVLLSVTIDSPSDLNFTVGDTLLLYFNDYEISFENVYIDNLFKNALTASSFGTSYTVSEFYNTLSPFLKSHYQSALIQHNIDYPSNTLPGFTTMSWAQFSTFLGYSFERDESFVDTLNNSLNELQDDYDALQDDYDELLNSYTILQSDYRSIQEQYPIYAGMDSVQYFFHQIGSILDVRIFGVVPLYTFVVIPVILGLLVLVFKLMR